MILQSDVWCIHIYSIWILTIFDEHFHISLLLRYMHMIAWCTLYENPCDASCQAISGRSFDVLRLHSGSLSVIIKYFVRFCCLCWIAEQRYGQFAGNH